MISLSPASVLGFSALFTAVYQTCFYALSVKFQNDQFTDVGGVSNFIFLAFINFIICGAYTNGHKSILLTYVLIWGARLMTFLYLRIVQWGGHDRRLDSIRSRPNGALIFWISQAVWVFTTSLPVTLAMVSEVSFVSWTKDIIGGILFIVGVLLEAISDQSKLIQQQRNDNDGDEEKWIHGGVWNWSRHPNYFGEILIWSSIYLTAEPILILPWKIVALISPIFTSLLLLFVSGVPLLEVNADRKFAHRQDYIDYKRNTSVLIPIPPTVYARIPRSIQKTLLLDFDMYYHFDEKRQILTTNGEKEATTQ